MSLSEGSRPIRIQIRSAPFRVPFCVLQVRNVSTRSIQWEYRAWVVQQSRAYMKLFQWVLSRGHLKRARTRIRHALGSKCTFVNPIRYAHLPYTQTHRYQTHRAIQSFHNGWDLILFFSLVQKEKKKKERSTKEKSSSSKSKPEDSKKGKNVGRNYHVANVEIEPQDKTRTFEVMLDGIIYGPFAKIK